MPIEALARAGGNRIQRLADLADRAGFDGYLGEVAATIADRFTLQVHVNFAARWRAYNGWIACLQDGGRVAADHQRFLRVVADLIAILGSRRIVTYSAMMRGRSDPMLDVVLKYPNEITALTAGAALYTSEVSALTGRDPSEALTPLVAENAAALLRRQPLEAAARFRELLRLSTPWS
jgi:hypothetical protein